MKTKKIFKILTIVTVIAIAATTVYAASPYLLPEPYIWQLDPLYKGNNPKEGNGLYQRYTAAQNRLAQHSEDEFTGQVVRVYTSVKVKVDVYYAASGSNVAVVMTSHDVLFVGCAGGGQEASTAFSALQASNLGLVHLNLSGIVFAGASPEYRFGCRVITRAFVNFEAPRYASENYSSALFNLFQVEEALAARQARALGQSLVWGPDGFLGAGSMKEYHPSELIYADPTVLVPQEGMSFYVENEGVTLIPNPAPSAGVMVYLGRIKLLIGGEGGAFLPDAGSFLEPGVPVQAHIDALQQVLDLGPDYYIPLHGRAIVGAQAIQDAFTAQRDALQWIRDETLKSINQGVPLEDIVANISLPADLGESPYNQEFTSTVGMIVRSVYHEYMGWFTGDPLELTSMNTREQAVRFCELAGGADTMLVLARKAASEDSLGGAIWALKLASQLRICNPSAEADGIYIAALQKLAWSTSSAYVRNYYLSLINEVQNSAP